MKASEVVALLESMRDLKRKLVIQTPDGHEYNVHSVSYRANRIVVSARPITEK